MTTIHASIEDLPQANDWIALSQETGKRTVILTPNRRLTAALHQVYRDHQLSACAIQWQTPLIMPIDRWFESLFLATLTHANSGVSPTLLNTSQTEFLWKRIIAQHELLQSIIQVKETARLMQSAWKLLINWRIALTEADCEDYQDYLLLLSCIQQYEEQCQLNNWLDHATLPAYIVNFIRENSSFRHELPDRIILSGFNELLPIQQAFFEELLKLNCIVTQTSLRKAYNQTVVTEALSTTHEYQLMANWAKMKIEADKDVHIACVIPNLPDVRDQVKKVFEEVFFEEKQYCYDIDQMIFNISAGKRLSEYQIIKTALHLLSIRDEIVFYEDLSLLLHSSFLGDYFTESGPREIYSFLLKKWNIHRISLSEEQHDFITSGDYALKQYCPLLCARLGQAIKLINTLPAAQTIDAWIDVFNQLLQIYGWPGEKSLDSYLFQVIDAWLQLFHKIASIQVVSDQLSYVEALSLLQDCTDNTLFQPKSPLAPIQILGTLEATGITFDYIWLSGLDDITWPPKPNPHPFIPKKIQIAYQMPHSSSLREYTYCQQLMKQFQASSQLLVCSYATQKEQLERYMSPLLYDLPFADRDLLSIDHTIGNFEKIVLSKEFEHFIDEAGPKVNRALPLKGGAAAIKAQSHCPFKGFAEWRLFARAYDTPTAALQASEKGLILHHIMSLIWADLKDHPALLLLNERDLNRVVIKKITVALHTYCKGKLKAFGYLKIEKKRLFKLIKNWLLLEKARPHFSVASIEEKVTATIAGIDFSFRLDRIDQIDNYKIIIDYKSSGYNKIQDWFAERPLEPQLIMYLLALQQDVIGISFAQLHINDITLKGVSYHDMNVAGIKPITAVKKDTTWDQQLEYWQANISHLCNEFLSGDARLYPVNQEATCSQCAQQPFCRIKEIMND